MLYIYIYEVARALRRVSMTFVCIYIQLVFYSCPASCLSVCDAARRAVCLCVYIFGKMTAAGVYMSVSILTLHTGLCACGACYY